MRAASERGLKQIVPHRVVNDAQHDLAVFLQGDGDAEKGEAVGVIRCSVERIDNPAHRAGAVFLL